MNERLNTPPITLSIAAVERDTGLSKDTLRVWERRYGFPMPLRDAFGERAYPLDQLGRLRTIKRLMDAGHRPGRIVPMAPADLFRLSESTVDAPQRGFDGGAPQDLRPFVDLLRAHDIVGLRQRLCAALIGVGLTRFVTEVVAPLNAMVGDAWMRGQMEIFAEHLYTETIQSVLRQGLAAIPLDVAARPRVLLTTLPGEPHSLGILMAESILALQGAYCLSLGVQTPLWDVVLASRALHTDVVALSFTGCMNPNQVVDALAELRAKLPPACELWAGGSAPVLHRRPVDGVRALSSLQAMEPELLRWRAAI